MKRKKQDNPPKKLEPLDDLSSGRYKNLLRWLFLWPVERVRKQLLKEWKIQVTSEDLRRFWESEVVQQDRRRYAQVANLARELVRQAAEIKAPFDEAICEKLKQQILELLSRPEVEPRTIKILHDMLMREKQFSLNLEKAKAAEKTGEAAKTQDASMTAFSDMDLLKILMDWMDKVLLGKGVGK